MIPGRTVGRLISMDSEPAVFTGTPKPKTSVGMMTSPPATPSRLLIAPIMNPNSRPAIMRVHGSSGRSPKGAISM
jgi:hypothetical protein